MVEVARSTRVNRSYAALAQFGRRHEVQTLGSASSNLAGGTESEPARVPGLAANECVPAGMSFDCSALLA